MSFVLPVVLPMGLPGEEDLPDLIPRAFLELETLSGSLSVFPEEPDLKTTFETFDKASDHPQFAEHWRVGGSSRQHWFIIAESMVRFDESLDDDCSYDISIDYESAFRPFLLCGNIAKPGALKIAEGVVFVDGEYTRTSEGFYTEFEVASEVSRTRAWPPVTELEIGQVWNWANSLPGFGRGIGEGPIGRALAALAHLAFSDFRQSGPMDLVWALLGLEAIYARGASGIGSQILEKAAVLLGAPENHKHFFAGLYDRRSRFLHGDVDLAFPGCDPVETQRHDSQHADSYYAALAMLLATIQQLVLRNEREVRFSYRLDGPS